MIIDLHIHSNFSSDGEYSPSEIAHYIKQKNISYFSIADHNTLNGCQEIILRKLNVGSVMIPAVEFSTFYGEHEVHVLAYGIKFGDEALKEVFEKINKNKIKQAYARTGALKQLGFEINFDDLMDNAVNNVPSGVTFLNVLLKNHRNREFLKEYTEGEKSRSPYTNFYFDFFAKGGKAHVHIPLIDIGDFFGIMKGNAVFSMAHPGLNPENIMDKLLAFPFDAIEVFSSYHDSDEINEFMSVAEAHKLFYTAGSDFHGPNIKPNIFLGVDSKFNRVIIENILNAIERKNLSVYNL